MHLQWHLPLLPNNSLRLGLRPVRPVTEARGFLLPFQPLCMALSLNNMAQFLATLLVPVSFEMFKDRVRNGMYIACSVIVAFVVAKELVYDPIVLHQSILHDAGDAVYYLLGGAAALIVILANRGIKKHRSKKKK